ncbi:MAG: PstS family phosphate ABC transporter substrate-binding protein [Leucobacter sp.]
MNRKLRISTVSAAFAIVGLLMTGCASQSGATDTSDGEGAQSLSGPVVIDGSSTVAPNTEVAAELFSMEQPDVQISVGVSGTGGGFEKFCNGETDVSEASRTIKDEEAARCAEAGIEFEELGVANDGLAVAVNLENTWAQCLTVDEISSMWRAESPVTNWSEVRAGFPDEEISLFGPGADSGTFDFFTEEINGEGGSINPSYADIGEDDHAAVVGVAGAKGASAFIPLSFVAESADQIKPIEIVNEAGDCVSPSLEAVLEGTYNPLGRQLYVYPSADALAKPQVMAFLEFYIQNQAEIAETAGFIPLNDTQEAEALDKLRSLVG